MAINLSNLSDVLTSKVASSNSSTSQAELDRQSSLSTKLSNFADAVTYTANTAFPAASVSNAGQIVYDSGADKYYFSTGSDWQSMGYYVPPRSNYGYVSGGYHPAISPREHGTIDKYPFSTDTNATDTGDLSQIRYRCEGCSSSTYGYVAGGQIPSTTNVIDKFQFGTDANATDVGDLSATKYWMQGAQSSENGYWAGGGSDIEKISFASEGNSSDIGDLTVSQQGGGGASSSTHGYTAGSGAWAPTDVIEKYPFATDSNSSSVGGLAVNASQCSGSFSETYGYIAGGMDGPPAYNKLNNIQKYPFAADSDSTDIADITIGRYGASGQSSLDYGYNSGGNVGGGLTIEKYAYATDSDATDVGDLTIGTIRSPAGNNQY
jgi:hypothetical protein